MTPKDIGAGEPDIRGEDTLTKGTLIGAARRIGERPCIVSADDDLREVAEALSLHRRVRTAAVVDEAGTLVGIIPMRLLLDELFLQVAPEEFLTEILDRERMAEYARMVRAHSAGELMQEPVYLSVQDTYGEAFARMHDCDLDGLPVVDGASRPIGYLDRLDLIRAWLKGRHVEESGSTA
jgi:CBS domain-containing protein